MLNIYRHNTKLHLITFPGCLYLEPPGLCAAIFKICPIWLSTSEFLDFLKADWHASEIMQTRNISNMKNKIGTKYRIFSLSDHHTYFI